MEVGVPTSIIKQFRRRRDKRCLSSKMKTLQIETQQFDLLLDGKIIPSKSGSYFDLINPSTGKVFAQVADATSTDMHTAISAARRAFDEGAWSGMAIVE